MAGMRGNQAYLVAAKQTGKGVAPTKWQDRYFFEGGNIAPTKGTDQLSETDNTRNAGDFYVTQTAVEGAPEFYVRDASIHHALEYVLGAATHSGTTNFTHVVTPASSLPYLTLGKAQGELLFETYSDLKADSLDLSWATASPGVATLSVMGLRSTRNTEVWQTELAPPVASEFAPLNYNQAVVKLGGAETRLISSFECTVSNGVSLQQTDDSVPYDVVEGTFAVTGGFDLIFESLAEYNKFHYGAAAGTTQTPELYSTQFSIELARGVNNSLLLEFPKIVYTEFPVEPDPSGGPVSVSVKFASQREPTNGFLKATVKNQTEK